MGKVCKSGGEGTFAERHGNGEVAPIPAVRVTLIEPRESTQSGPQGGAEVTAMIHHREAFGASRKWPRSRST
jgi:hypothetical protein